ncbi:MAG: hypothetical protein ACQETX_11570 [Pseudomonadota bacterium]
MNNRFKAIKERNPAQIYNEKRRIVLRKMMADPSKARKWLDGYREVLGRQGYAGLKAELDFFERYRYTYQLTPALDVGDATDFVGEIDGRMQRIDVTTNIKFKKLETYEPFQTDGHLYRIAVWDGGDFELVDINFPFCDDCGDGRILPTGILLGENYNRHGESQWSHDQNLVMICSSCGNHEIIDAITTHFLYDFNRCYQMANEALDETLNLGGSTVDIEKEIQDYAVAALRYLRQSFGQYLVAVGGIEYEITNPTNADGCWQFRLEQISPLAEAYLQGSYPWYV